MFIEVNITRSGVGTDRWEQTLTSDLPATAGKPAAPKALDLVSARTVIGRHLGGDALDLMMTRLENFHDVFAAECAIVPHPCIVRESRHVARRTETVQPLLAGEAVGDLLLFTFRVEAEEAIAPKPAEKHVITEIVYFQGDKAYHFVDVQEDEHERLRLFRRKPTGTQKGRHQDGDRYFSIESRKSHDDGRRYAEPDDLPEHEHASFAAFLEHVGYDWTSNSYRKGADAEAIAA